LFVREFEPKNYLQQIPTTASTPYSKRNKQDIVLFCGSPGVGKSTFYWENLKPLGYERINQDILKSRDRCLKVAREQLNAGNSVAIDNTNADIDTRAHWLRLAEEFGIPVRCVHFTATPRLCEHNDCVRALNPDLMNPEKRPMLPGFAFRSFQQRYSAPSIDEGFQDITKVDFQFQGTAEQQQIWGKYWISKFST
jgi:bifunctional polynucleotide phosphatase/kinase